MTVAEDVDAERVLLADTLETLGPDAAAGCGRWTAFDVAAHVVASDRAAGAFAFGIRVLAARGVQFHPQPKVVASAINRERRDGYPAVVARLRRPSPRLLLAPAVAASSLFEVWMHHDDLAAANGLAHGAPNHLADAIPSLVRYQGNRLVSADRLIVRTTGGTNGRSCVRAAVRRPSYAVRQKISSDGSPAEARFRRFMLRRKRT